jgi:nucleoside-diphosphate-sugar epimerase
MQTILGAGGAIGNRLAHELRHYTGAIRLVSRHPKKVNETDELMAADLTDAAATANAVNGSEVVYLLAGLPYKLKVWQQQWPMVMQNVIAACKQHNARLVFFDNLYLYSKADMSHMTEETAVDPPSKKGAVRATIVQTLMDEVKKGTITALIARSADFYGPAISNSILIEMVYKNLQKGKKAMWLADTSKIHSFTYTPDAARAVALLGNTPEGFNQVWHLPTSAEKITGNDWISRFAKALEVSPKKTVLSKGMVKMLGLFLPVLRESYEMLYQYDRDYFFDSGKFNRRFPDFKTTSYEEGINEVVQAGRMAG